MKYLIVVDAQVGFTTGSLPNKDAVAALPYIKNKIDEFRREGATIIFTRDTHTDDYMNTLEGKHLPIKHCVKGTDDWQICKELEPERKDIIIDKPTFGYNGWFNTPTQDGDEIYMMGFCTDICVISNALILKSYYPKSEVYILKNGCAGLTKEKHEHALDVMASCQCNIVE